MGSISNDALVQSFEAESAIAKKGMALKYGSGAKKADIAGNTDRLLGLSYATTKDPITSVAVADVQIGVVPLMEGLEVTVPLIAANQVIAFGDDICVASSDDGLFDLYDGTTQTGTIIGQAIEVVLASAGGYVKIRIGRVPDPTTIDGVDGLITQKVARATYDFAVDGGAVSVIDLGVDLPDNAIVTRAWYEVITTLESSGDAATIAIGINTDDTAGIVAAVAISAATDWDVGNHEGIQDGTAAAFAEKTTAARAIEVTIAVEAVTAGKFVVFAEYVVSD